MWRFTRSNGITEGFHNKMETISRQAYGFRNFENYRQRVQVLCVPQRVFEEFGGPYATILELSWWVRIFLLAPFLLILLEFFTRPLRWS